MSGLQSSFNSNCQWEGKSMTNRYFKNRGHEPANQFQGFMPVEQAKARAVPASPPHEVEDHLVMTFLIFFLIYAFCRITL